MTTPQQPAQLPQGNPSPRHSSLRPRPLASRRDASQQANPDHTPAPKRARPNTPANASGAASSGRANMSGQRVANTGAGANSQVGGGRQQAGVNQARVSPAGVSQAGVSQAGVSQAGVNPAGVNQAGANQASTNQASGNHANAHQANASHASNSQANVNQANGNPASAAQPGINQAGGFGANQGNPLPPNFYHLFPSFAEQYNRCNIAIFHVGPTPVIFHVDVDTLLVRSPNFHRFCMVECAERGEQHKPPIIRLPDLCPTTFTSFLKWMGNGDPFGGRSLPKLTPFFSLWRFSERFQCFLLQSDLLAYLQRWLGSHRGLFGVSVIRLVYTMFDRDSHMRKMVAEVNAWRSGLADLQNTKADVPREYIEDLAEALLAVRRTDPLTGLPGDFVARYMPMEEEKVPGSDLE
ncbi:hypothetical protein ASPACDRAFT_108896 [Aspergillus aculeatus ATCC 16872]|uniref:BTB domain-containing protein n=1 Tax=Aspergillus aculeatus (strain ATCC 16872 / CBS 172.66 / WB 5094) TaxID=690307 RepID=A0A1L9X7H8_ASPA1|nr:uncharacterized protein ASPACDRAFT_108896 [Aspergillus aculeatus ATCC 16872]OJK04405.1 hypothetical protein ASPACDRAFT_108896 [Aspergillus aculeatus ATCC 16872]